MNGIVEKINPVILDGEFKLEKFLRHDGHADVYSVSAIVSQTTPLEARAYSLENLTKKLRQYRLRNMKRLAGRILLKTQWQGMVVIIYKTGKGGDVDDSANNVAVKKLPLDEKPAPVVVNEKLQQKSGIQREKARIRQLERRKLSRQKERHLRTDKGLKDTTMADDIPMMIEADNKERPHAQLQLIKGDQPLDPKELAALCRVVVKDFIRQGLKLGDNEKREEVLGVMLREVSFLLLKQKQKTQDSRLERYEGDVREISS